VSIAQWVMAVIGPAIHGLVVHPPSFPLPLPPLLIGLRVEYSQHRRELMRLSRSLGDRPKIIKTEIAILKFNDSSKPLEILPCYSRSEGVPLPLLHPLPWLLLPRPLLLPLFHFHFHLGRHVLAECLLLHRLQTNPIGVVEDAVQREDPAVVMVLSFPVNWIILIILLSAGPWFYLFSLKNLAFPVNLDVFFSMASFFLFMLMSAIAIAFFAVRTVCHERIHYTGIFLMIKFEYAKSICKIF
jgi:hypothetical protein